MESERFPISTFIGHISDFQTLDLTSQQTLYVSGEFFYMASQKYFGDSNSV